MLTCYSCICSPRTWANRIEQHQQDVAHLLSTLSDVDDRLSSTKRGVHEWGQRIVDNSGVVKLKRAVGRLQKDAKDLNMRIGICQSRLETARARALTREASGVASGGGGGGGGLDGFSIEDDDRTSDDISDDDDDDRDSWSSAFHEVFGDDAADDE